MIRREVSPQAAPHAVVTLHAKARENVSKERAVFHPGRLRDVAALAARVVGNECGGPLCR